MGEWFDERRFEDDVGPPVELLRTIAITPADTHPANSGWTADLRTVAGGIDPSERLALFEPRSSACVAVTMRPRVTDPQLPPLVTGLMLVTNRRGSTQNRRLVQVPPWGRVVNVTAGQVTLDVGLDASSPVGVDVHFDGSAGYGWAVPERLDAGVLVIPSGGSVTLRVPDYARLLFITLLQGTIDLPTNLIAPNAPTQVLAAGPMVVHNNGAGVARVSIAWEIMAP